MSLNGHPDEFVMVMYDGKPVPVMVDRKTHHTSDDEYDALGNLIEWTEEMNEP